MLVLDVTALGDPELNTALQIRPDPQRGEPEYFSDLKEHSPRLFHVKKKKCLPEKGSPLPWSVLFKIHIISKRVYIFLSKTDF